MLQSCDKGMSMFPERQKCLSLGPPRNNLPCRTKHHIIIYTHVLQYSVHRPSLCDRDVESWGKRGDLEDDRTFSIISAMVSDMTRGIHTSNDVGVSQIARVIPSQETIALSPTIMGTSTMSMPPDIVWGATAATLRPLTKVAKTSPLTASLGWRSI